MGDDCFLSGRLGPDLDAFYPNFLAARDFGECRKFANGEVLTRLAGPEIEIADYDFVGVAVLPALRKLVQMAILEEYLIVDVTDCSLRFFR